jgi:outer membrane protein TolC
MKNLLKSYRLKFYKFILFIVLIPVTPLLAQVQQSTPSGDQYNFTRQQAIDFALQHQSTLQNAKIDETIADQKVRELLSVALPQVNGSAELDDYVAKPVTILPAAFGSFFGLPPGKTLAVSFLLQYQATAGVSASQILFDGTVLLGIKAAKTYAELSRKITRSSSIDVVANVTKAYYGVIINENNLSSLDSTITLLQKSLDDAKAMYAQGFVEKLDVDRLTVTLSNLQSQRQNLRSIVDLNYYLLKFQMGMPVNASLTLAGKIPDQFQEPAIETADYNKRIEYSILETARELDAFNVRRYNEGYLPTLSAFGSLSAVNYQNEADLFNPKDQWFPTGLVGLRLNVPIFDGFRKDAQIQQAKMAMMQNQNDISNFKNLVDLQVKQSSIGYENSYKILISQKANLKLAEDVARVTKIKYEEGVGTNLEVTTAESDLITAQTNYFNALYNLAIAHVDLLRAKGTLY